MPIQTIVTNKLQTVLSVLALYENSQHPFYTPERSSRMMLRTPKDPMFSPQDPASVTHLHWAFLTITC